MRKIGGTKSFRLNDRVENMFNSLKKYYLEYQKVTDSDIISSGIEMQFENISNHANKDFRNIMLSIMNEESTKDVFNNICDILEALSFSDGFFLEDEFRFFLYSIFGGDLQYVYGEEIENLSLSQYEKIWDIVKSRHKNINEEVDKIESLFCGYYEKK